MKIGDRIRITRPDFSAHEVGDLGTIHVMYWADHETKMFGVELDNRAPSNSEGDGLWAYSDEEMEVV